MLPYDPTISIVSKLLIGLSRMDADYQAHLQGDALTSDLTGGRWSAESPRIGCTHLLLQAPRAARRNGAIFSEEDASGGAE